MPSGSKKRKAAKKKKEIHSTNYPNPSSPVSAHSNGGDDVDHEDDKGSDVGEMSSPASNGNRGGQPEGGDEEIEVEDNVSSIPSVRGSNVEVGEAQNVVEEDKNVVLVGREFKIEDKPAKEDETLRKSYNGGSSGCSSGSGSGSDDESHGNKSSKAVVVDNAPSVDVVEEGDSLSGGQADPVYSSTVEEAVDSVVFKQNAEEKPEPVEDKVETAPAYVDAASSQRRKEEIVQSVEAIVTIPDVAECVAQQNNDRLNIPDSAPIAAVDNGTSGEKDSDITEPLLVPVVRPEQKASWKSCCGLFEVFTGSGS